ncbi:TlyA family RNA methyltransferase [Candidatus Parcubacteria bacterium]|nr:TlyA family RNA methyltransferase [Candidatus Parcubacteria bacterium]
MKLVSSRSQAENYIKLGYVKVDGRVVDRPSKQVTDKSVVTFTAEKTYVSRAALKLESVADGFKLNFNSKVVLDVGSSTGGFSEYTLRHGAAKIIAVEAGKNQMNPVLRQDKKIELHEQTDIRDVNSLSTKVDIVLIDVSFISIREVLLHLRNMLDPDSLILAMVKPQFEMLGENRKHKGVVKNESIRRAIFKEFEQWVKQKYKIMDKADSRVSGEKGNRERFYLLKPIRNQLMIN